MKKRGLLCAGIAVLSIATLASCGRTSSGDSTNNSDVTKIALVTDSGTLNDHNFNESSWNALNKFASENGGGKITTQGVKDGKIQTNVYQPSKSTGDDFVTQDRLEAMRSAVEWGAQVLVLPGYLFQSAIARALEQPETFGNVYMLALDCTQSDDDNNYASYEYTDKITSIVYQEEQSGWLAGYAAVMDGYTSLGFVGGMPVPAVIRYGSGFFQGAEYAAKSLNKTGLKGQLYYAGKFAATAEATEYASKWYQANGNAQITFACGGAVYQSVKSASDANNHAPWIGVDTNQHADTTNFTPAEQKAIITSAMKNLGLSVERRLGEWMQEKKWDSSIAGKVVTLGAADDMCKLPTPEEDNDAGCWGFKTFTEEKYKEIYAKVKSGEIKIDNSSDVATLSKNNYGVDKNIINITITDTVVNQ